MPSRNPRLLLAVSALGSVILLQAACLLTVSTTGLSGGVPGPDGAPEDAPGPGNTPTGEAGGGGDARGETTYAQLVLDDTPIAYWRFEETTGLSAHDETNHGHDAAYAPQNQGAPGIAGSRGVDLKPTLSATVATNDAAFQFAGNHPFAVECWISLRTTSAFARLATTEAPDPAPTSGWFFTPLEGPGPYFSFREESGTFIEELQGNVKLGVGGFHHLVVSHDGSTATMWLDAVAIGSASWSGQTQAIGTLTWGCRPSSGNCVDGVLDEAAVYDHPLVAERVKAHYAAGKP
jgi:hypothetical protein